MPMAPILSAADANKRLHKRSSSAGKANAKLPGIPSCKRFADESLNMFEAFKSCEEREKIATMKAEQMLDDKCIHSSVRELKFKANLPRLSEDLLDAETWRPSASHAFSGLQQLTEQLKASQRKVVKVDRVGMASILDVSKDKLECLMEDQDALSSVLKETQPLINAKKRSKNAMKVELFDRSETNSNTFRKRFHSIRDKVSDGTNANQWQKELRDVMVPLLRSTGNCVQ
jgi:hypothetical protein